MTQLILKFDILLNVAAKLTRRVSGILITDLAQALGHVFGYGNMKKAAKLDPNTPKTQVMGISFI